MAASKEILVAIALVAASLSGCETKESRRSGNNAGASTDAISLQLPDFDAFKLEDGKPQDQIDTYWYTLVAEDEACDPRVHKNAGAFAGSDVIEIATLQSCDYELTLSLGKDKKAIFKTDDPVAISPRKGAFGVRLKRTALGESLGFKNPWVESADASPNDSQKAAVTFEQVKDILDAHCVSCHVKSGTRPNSDLTSFAGARAFAELLTDYVVGSRMPPPPASISDEDKQTIKQWQLDGFLDIGGTKSETPPDDSKSTDQNVVAFHIASGTGNGSWNTASSPIVAKVGQTIRIFNDDTVVHQLHTDGAPCAHGEEIQPEDSSDCVVSSEFKGGTLHDHITEGLVYLTTVAQ